MLKRCFHNHQVVNAHTNEVEQITHYYPYGGIIGNLSSNQEDDSAYPFMEKIDDDGENLLTYMEKGRNGQEYDFKIRGDKYRGMLASFMGGAETIASARDIGNYAAGYKAGSKGLSPVITFAGFSAYDCKKNGRIGIEPSGSRKPQWMGYKSGFKKYLRKSIGL